MKLLFLNLPYRYAISRCSRWPEKTKSGTLYYPYWLCYCAGVCIERGHEVNVVDCIARKLTVEQTVKLAMEYSPDIIVTETTTPTCRFDYNTINSLRKALPGAKIFVGGTHATVLPGDVLTNCAGADVVLRQEYDFTVPELIDNLDDYSHVKGISYRCGDRLVHNADRPWTENLDALPFVSKVYQRFLNPDDYFYAFAQKPMIQIFSSRGCPFRCNFCSYPETMSGRVFRKRSVENFVDELEYIANEMPQIREIFIEDDTFTVDKKRVVEICDEIIRRRLSIVWSANTRADLPYNVMEKMRQAGCRLLVVGYESGNQEVLNQTNKGIRLEQSLEFAKNTKKLGIKVFGCFMIGLKGDTLETIRETYRFAKKTAPDMVFFQQAVPFPGTVFYRWVKENGMLVTEDFSKWLNADGYLDCLVNYPYASAREIEKIRDHLMTKYYFSFTYLFKTFLRNFSWSELKRVMKAGFTYIAFRLRKMLKKHR